MKTNQRPAAIILTATMLLGLSGCAGMSERDRNTAVGAGIGAVGGAILTNGNPLGAVGGAAVGGVIGSQTGHDRR